MDPDFPYSDPTFPYSPGTQTDPDRYAARSLTPPPDLPRPVDPPQAGTETETAPGHHKGHNHWMHLLMCAPLVLVVGYLVLAGKVGGGAILYAVGCLVMMGVMMAMMNHGSGDNTSDAHSSGNHPSGHRH